MASTKKNGPIPQYATIELTSSKAKPSAHISITRAQRSYIVWSYFWFSQFSARNYVNLSGKWPVNHGSVGRSCYKTLTKEPEDSGVCKPHTYIASHADVLSGCGAGTRDVPLLAVLFAECAYDMSGETAGGFFSRLFFSPLVCARFCTCFCGFAARSSALSTNKLSATHCCVGF